MTRLDDFNKIKKALSSELFFEDEDTIIANQDSVDALKLVPDHSVSLILTDPPYHSTKKGNIINDKAFDSDDSFISWMKIFALEWKRILKPNGSVFVFCSSAMEAKLEIMFSQYFNVLSHIVWTKPNEPGFDGWKGKMKKEALRQWYPHSERIIFLEPALNGNLKRSYFGSLLKQSRIDCKMSGHELTEKIGAYGKVNHGGAVSNWESGRNIPSKEQYLKICEVLKNANHNIKMPQYEDVIRPFEVNANVEFTDVWNFPSVRPYKGKHPAEKPVEMLEHCIKATTFEGDIILDCFAGSGSTGIAALREGRKFIGFEIDEKWCESIKKRVLTYKNLPADSLVTGRSLMIDGLKYDNRTPSLFDNASVLLS